MTEKRETRVRWERELMDIRIGKSSGHSHIRHVYLEGAFLRSCAPSPHPLMQLVAFSIDMHTPCVTHPAQRLSCRWASGSSTVTHSCPCSTALSPHYRPPLAAASLTPSSKTSEGHTILMPTALRAFPTQTVAQDESYLTPIPLPNVRIDCR
ncbi:hypothetical protein EI94DRAFT_1767711 [Lactarius quietus]|nr:hypothetical protein EI94DRAFT_1767711 [Lactarius quietus]